MALPDWKFSEQNLQIGYIQVKWPMSNDLNNRSIYKIVYNEWLL